MKVDAPFRSAWLNGLLLEELALGNSIQDQGSQWGKWVQLIRLVHPFGFNSLPSSLLQRHINDPHYWKTEIEDPDTMEMLVCGFV